MLFLKSINNKRGYMESKLLANFVDGSDTKIDVDLRNRKVTIVAFDDKSMIDYQMLFENCSSIQVNYSLEEDSDLDNLHEIVEEQSSKPYRKFIIYFADGESNLSIVSREFKMQQVGVRLPWRNSDWE